MSSCTGDPPNKGSLLVSCKSSVDESAISFDSVLKGGNRQTLIVTMGNKDTTRTIEVAPDFMVAVGWDLQIGNVGSIVHGRDIEAIHIGVEILGSVAFRVTSKVNVDILITIGSIVNGLLDNSASILRSTAAKRTATMALPDFRYHVSGNTSINTADVNSSLAILRA